MARPIQFRIQGYDEFLRKLDRMQDKVRIHSEMQSVLFECVQDFRKAALANAMRLFKRHTGNLFRSLIAQIGKTPNPSAWLKAAWHAAPHAHLLEFGHRIVGHQPRKTDTGKVTVARPWFRPAIDELKAPVKRKIESKVRIALMK